MSETGGSAAPVRHRRRRRLAGSYKLMKGKLSLMSLSSREQCFLYESRNRAVGRALTQSSDAILASELTISGIEWRVSAVRLGSVHG